MAQLQLLLVTVLLFFAVGAAAADESCECLESTCGPCEVETGTTFYSAKCGPGLTKVKSCKKATCEAVDNQKQCLALFNKAPADTKATSVEVSSTREIANHAPEAGQIVDIAGEAKIHHANGVTEKPRKRESAYVGDVVETAPEARVKILLRDGSEMIVAPNSRVKIEKVEVSGITKRQIAMQVLAGKVRNKVQKEYKGDNYYQVRTETAVAGVRGTDFIVSFEPGAQEWVSEVRTIEGLVKLQSAIAATEGGVPAWIEIPAGTYGSVIHEAPSSSVGQQLEEVAARSRVTPLYKMKEEDLRALKNGEDFLAARGSVEKTPTRSIASESSDEICQAPAGRFNQCSWTCENNPKGEKTCRTDLPNVTCVRRLCRANGMWVEPKRVPASESSRCVGNQPTVRDCESYW